MGIEEKFGERSKRNFDSLSEGESIRCVVNIQIGHLPKPNVNRSDYTSRTEYIRALRKEDSRIKREYLEPIRKELHGQCGIELGPDGDSAGNYAIDLTYEEAKKLAASEYVHAIITDATLRHITGEVKTFDD